ncbi:MAG: porin, partial [Burkholderiales bacterium]|nr:porin [Burkholderiales bacterium]
MKKSLLALAAMTAFAGAASAQSSVTLFGVVDLSANSVKAGSQTARV